jgi:5-methyltetrahydrofolate--homocysteine methyltransferase
MIDSSKWEILEAGLQCVQGKSIINSISLKEGEEKFLKKARYIHSMGAATVVMLFDEKGQADTYERKVEVARRAYKLLRDIDFPGEDIIFDPNVLAVATGMPEHDDYGRAFIEACRTIHEEMPEVHMSGGISNLSFSFRGNNPVRQAMHSVFLYHAIKAGLDMSIVNPAMLTIYDEIEEPMRTYVEDVILNRDSNAPERLIEFATKLKEELDAKKEANGGKAPEKKIEMPTTLKERIAFAMLKGITDSIDADTLEAYEKAGTPLGVIDEYLMPAMEQVGKLFGEGKMFLPQVVKSARVMKKAVAVLEPYMTAPSQPPRGEETLDSNDAYEIPQNTSPQGAGTVVMATVKGDVHDIGKNIVAVVTQCNGFNVKDLGVMVEPETIVEEAQKCNADVIGLSGLITPSLTEMINVVKLLESKGMTTPVIIGGATTSALHTAVKIAPEYPHGIVICAHAAADNPGIIRRLLADDGKEYIAELKAQQKIIRDNYNRREADKSLLTVEESRKRRFIKNQELVAVPRSTEQVLLYSQLKYNCTANFQNIRISDLEDRINWAFFYQAWGLKGDVRTGEEGQKLRSDAEALLEEMKEKNLITLQGTARILPAYSTDNDEIIVSCDGKDYTLPFPRSLKDEEQTNCLADHIMRGYRARKLTNCPCCQGQHATDFICPFVVTAGVGLKELQENYRKEGDEYHAIMAKLLCDRLAEAFAEYIQDYMQKRLFWGTDGIRMAFGYGACPDHALKVPVLDMLKADKTIDISLTESNMINPGESICGLIFANTPLKYFNV